MVTLYEKVGRRYLPVAERDLLGTLENGVWVVDVRDGRKFAVRAVDPGPTLEQLAAIPTLEELISRELIEHHRSEPSSRPTTAREKKAWAAYCAVMGPDATLSLDRPSAHDVARRVAGTLVALARVSSLISTKARGGGDRRKAGVPCP